MIIDTNNITPEAARQLAALLHGPLYELLTGQDEVVIAGQDRAVKRKTRMLDSGLIGSQTHAELKTARAELTAASNDAEKIIALEKLVAAHDVILDGRKED